MNQHFIYNTLNHVQYFINKGEKESALNVIIKLSRLLRQWMPDTERASVSVTDEVCLLHTYLTLEQMRFPGRFTFDVITSVAKSDNVFITPQLIFPLAEHAVGWCLKHPENGVISINLFPEEPFIGCTVCAQAGQNSLPANLHLLPRINNTA